MRALVTGATGFLGKHLVEELLAAGFQIRCLARTRSEWQSPRVEFFPCDLRDAVRTRASCADVDIVFHAGAATGLWGHRKDYFETNVLGTRHIVEGCRAHRVPRLLYTSTPSVTFDGRPQENVDERVGYADRWLSYYAETKAIAEQEVLAANGDGLATCALRPHTIWGPGDRHLLPRIIARARTGRLRRIGEGENLIDMVYVEDAAHAHLLAAAALSEKSRLAGEAYFISQGTPVNCWQWINEVLVLASLHPVKRSISLRSAYLAGWTFETVYRTLGLQKEPPLTRYLALLLGTSHYYDIRRARDDFGFAPRVTKDEGMRLLSAELVRLGQSDAHEAASPRGGDSGRPSPWR